MFGLIGKAICAILSLLCFGYSGMCLFTNTDKQVDSYVIVEDHNVHPENEGKLVLMRGKLTYNGALVEDPDTGVRIKSPILQRNTEMFQFIPTSSDEKLRTSRTGWEKNGVPSFTDRYGRRHSNPAFPSGIPRNKDFAVDLTMEKGNLKIDADFVKALSYGQYVTFKDHYNDHMKNVVKLPSNKIPNKFRNLGNMYYRFHSNDDDSIFETLKLKKASNSRVGDIRIAYKAFKWDDNLPEFTIIGYQENGKLLRKEGALFYDYRLDDDKELKREVRKYNRYAMLGGLFCGIILFALALVV